MNEDTAGTKSESTNTGNDCKKRWNKHHQLHASLLVMTVHHLNPCYTEQKQDPSNRLIMQHQRLSLDHRSYDDYISLV